MTLTPIETLVSIAIIVGTTGFIGFLGFAGISIAEVCGKIKDTQARIVEVLDDLKDESEITSDLVKELYRRAKQ